MDRYTLDSRSESCSEELRGPKKLQKCRDGKTLTVLSWQVLVVVRADSAIECV
jgi:hypothetical protein